MVIDECILSNNEGTMGGGIYCFESETTITNCTISGNASLYHGGGIYCDGTVGITDCTIRANSVELAGGGIYCAGVVVIRHCSIIDNRCEGSVSDSYEWGGGIYSDGAILEINDSVISRNVAGLDGGMSCRGSEVIISDCIISRNSSSGYAAGVRLTRASCLMRNCTFSQNDTAGSSGGVMISQYGDLAIANCIFWNNISPNGRNIVLHRASNQVQPTTARVSHSNVEGGQARVYIQNSNCKLSWDNSNIEADPRFVNPSEGDYHLSPVSRCIEGGDPCYVPVGETDIDGEPRIIGRKVDIGADEFVFDRPHIQVPLEPVKFHAIQGHANPEARTLSIYNPGVGSLNWHVTENCPWLEIAPTSGTVSTESDEFTLAVDATTMPWGVHDCNLIVSDPCASNSPVIVPVSLDVTGPILSVSPDSFNFLASKENPTPTSQTLHIQNIGGGTLDWRISGPDDCTWLDINPLNGQSTGDIDEVTLSADAAGLEYGSYSCQLLISDPNAQRGSETIQVSLTVQAPLIAVQPTNFQLRAWRSDPCLCEGALYIHNQGKDTLNWEISVPNDCIWLSIYPLTGQSRGDVNEVTLTVDTSGLADGFYSCSLSIADPNAANSPQTVNVFLHLGLEEGWLYVPGEFPNIQSAIDWALPGDVVVVWPGTYTGPGNRDIDFRGKAITVQGIDPNNPAVVASTVIDCNANPADRHRGFNFHTSEDANSILAGFTIINGYADQGAGIRIAAGGGRGVPLTGPVKCRILNCIITRNTAIYDGGGVYILASSPTITNCTITDNKSRSGGGSYCSGSNAVIHNCLFSGNSAQSAGGAVYNYQGNLSLTNVTVAENSAKSSGGALYCGYSGKPTITNSILYFNSAPEGPEIALAPYDRDPSLLNLAVSYSNIRGGYSAVWNYRGAVVDWGPGNIDVEPYFVDANNSDYRLKSRGWRWDAQRKTWTWDTVTSRCIDAGNPDAPLRDEPLFVPVDPTGYWGQNLRINMGAYGGTAEASIPPHGWAVRTDYNNDGIANFTDFAYWTESHPYIAGEPLGPLNPGPALNPIDLAILGADWLDQTTWFGIVPPPTAAWNPNPPDGAVGIRLDPVLGWQAGAEATSHDVYFGTSDPPTFQASTTATTFVPGYLSKNTTYYWRIDEVNSFGKTTGPVWSFTTGTGGGGR
jgi:parallel beta-helix repeat protein/predicted outer membrane repeat protein